MTLAMKEMVVFLNPEQFLAQEVLKKPLLKKL